MFGHIDELESHFGGVQSGADDGLWRTDEGEHGAIGRRSGVDVQQADTVHGPYGLRQRINNLFQVAINNQKSICYK